MSFSVKMCFWARLNCACVYLLLLETGLTGALMAMLVLREQSAPPILNLRNINPYVASSLGNWASQKHLMATAPRQYNGGAELAGNVSAGQTSLLPPLHIPFSPQSSSLSFLTQCFCSMMFIYTEARQSYMLIV